jgi:hypothetical protein
MEFNFESSIRGYHVYKSIWTYEIGEKIHCDREENNPNDKFAPPVLKMHSPPGSLLEEIRLYLHVLECNTSLLIIC